MILSHRIQLDPTEAQKEYFARACGTARMVWNWALAEWGEQYKIGGQPSANELSRYFNSFKYEKFPWLRDIHKNAHAEPFRNLRRAFSKFFKGEAKYPKFKKKGKCRDSFYIQNDAISVRCKNIRIPLLGWIRTTEELRFDGKIMRGVVIREADKWFISITVEMPDPSPTAPKGDPVGIDLGLTHFATMSTGEKIEAPKPLARHLSKLRKLSRKVSRKKLGSKNRTKAVTKVARLHRRIKNVRKDFLHKLSTKLTKNHSEICVEDLSVANMVQNGHLARAISDANWSEFKTQLEYKTRLYGSTLTVRDRFFASSKLCSDCGHKVEALPLSVREWTCPSCGSIHDRDINAAKNLLKAPDTSPVDGDQNETIPAARRESTPVETEALAPDGGCETMVCEAGTTNEAEIGPLTR
jgi:putative transposase